MTQTIPGIHHVTAIAIDPQANIDFYTRVLGLRFVKETVNFDDSGTYHFYYGDITGRPGTILTFFPFVMATRGRTGSGMVDTVTFAVPSESIDRWMVRLSEHGMDFDEPFTRFSHPVIGFRDPDGLKLEIATLESAGEASISAADRGAADSICGFDGVTLCVEAPERTIKLLTDTFGYRQVADESGRIRFHAGAGDGGIGTSIDVLCHPEAMRSRLGGGTVHHVAFRARTDEEQKIWREQIVSLGFNVTPILDWRFGLLEFRPPYYPSVCNKQSCDARWPKTSLRK